MNDDIGNEERQGPFRYELDEDYIRDLRAKNFDWTRISKMIGVSRSTIYRWIERSGYVDTFRSKGEYTREELRDTISNYLDGHYERGKKWFSLILLRTQT